MQQKQDPGRLCKNLEQDFHTAALRRQLILSSSAGPCRPRLVPGLHQNTHCSCTGTCMWMCKHALRWGVGRGAPSSCSLSHGLAAFSLGKAPWLPYLPPSAPAGPRTTLDWPGRCPSGKSHRGKGPLGDLEPGGSCPVGRKEKLVRSVRSLDSGSPEGEATVHLGGLRNHRVSLPHCPTLCAVPGSCPGKAG